MAEITRLWLQLHVVLAIMMIGAAMQTFSVCDTKDNAVMLLVKLEKAPSATPTGCVWLHNTFLADVTIPHAVIQHTHKQLTL